MISSGPREIQQTFLTELSDEEILALPFLFDFWALDHQLPPPGNWRTWVVLGGRGAGKTRAGAEWVRAQVEGARPAAPGRARRLALIGETFDQVRDVMIEGESGILACAPPDRAPLWESSKRTLTWPNGAQAFAFSAHEPSLLRGPQFDAAWVDELAKWKKGQETWDMLQFALRLGDHPQQCVTTTPRNVDALKSLLGLNSTVMTHATTFDNRANLADSFLKEVKKRYGKSRLGLQELDGEILEEVTGALWTHRMLDENRIDSVPDLARVVVAVDPPASKGKSADTCGIVVAGLTADGMGVVLEDCSVQGLSPAEWAQVAIAAFHRHQADRMIAEINQGGNLVEAVIRQQDRTVSYKPVHASRGKSVRAEPVASLYERGRVKHLGLLDKLEPQMTQMAVQGYQGTGSPDRVDALVWALSELMLGRESVPNIRGL